MTSDELSPDERRRLAELGMKFRATYYVSQRRWLFWTLLVLGAAGNIVGIATVSSPWNAVLLSLFVLSGATFWVSLNRLQAAAARAAGTPSEQDTTVHWRWGERALFRRLNATPEEARLVYFVIVCHTGSGIVIEGLIALALLGLS